MSYVRFSEDGSDVYCFCNGEDYWTTHVAMNRLQGDERRPIGLPHDGETFIDRTLQDLKARLLSLRQLGYHVPDGPIERIDRELAGSQS